MGSPFLLPKSKILTKLVSFKGECYHGRKA